MLMDQQHPITPPPELVREWNEAAIGTRFPPYGYSEYIATKAARWGADQELEAYSELLLNSAPWTVDPNERPEWVQTLKRCRRPKPPSLAEQALMGLEQTVIMLMPVTGRKKNERFDIIRRALERLKELESNG